MALDAQISQDQSSAEPLPPSADAATGDATGGAGNGSGVGAAARGIAPVWLQRLSLFVLVLFCVYLGVLVMILPWWTRVWDHNGLIESHPELAAVLHTGAMRGLISGLGLLDIWIGVSEAIHYRDHRP